MAQFVEWPAAAAPPALKRCPGCGQRKPIAAYRRNGARYDGLADRCWACELSARKAVG